AAGNVARGATAVARVVLLRPAGADRRTGGSSAAVTGRMDMPKPIHEQVIVVTGASSGIGLVTAREAARLGAKVVLAARNVRDLDQAAEEIGRDGGEAIAVPTDVSDYEQVHALAERAASEYGRIDTWVNNAAVSA